jgi:hypothetical protein
MLGPHGTGSVSNLAKRFWSLLVMLLCTNFGNKSRKKAIFPKLLWAGSYPLSCISTNNFGYLWVSPVFTGFSRWQRQSKKQDSCRSTGRMTLPERRILSVLRGNGYCPPSRVCAARFKALVRTPNCCPATCEFFASTASLTPGSTTAA